MFMSSAAYMTYVSKNKQCGPNQTAPDLDPILCPPYIHKSVMSSQYCSIKGLSQIIVHKRFSLLSDPETQKYFLSLFNP